MPMDSPTNTKLLKKLRLQQIDSNGSFIMKLHNNIFLHKHDEEYIRKDRRKEVFYYVNLIRAC